MLEADSARLVERPTKVLIRHPLPSKSLAPPVQSFRNFQSTDPNYNRLVGVFTTTARSHQFSRQSPSLHQYVPQVATWFFLHFT
jgi:hypothetical protein